METIAYNSREHDFIERTDEQLQERLSELHVNYSNIGYVGLRLTQILNEINQISFEMAERMRFQKEQDIEEAWSLHGE